MLEITAANRIEKRMKKNEDRTQEFLWKSKFLGVGGKLENCAILKLFMLPCKHIGEKKKENEDKWTYIPEVLNLHSK